MEIQEEEKGFHGVQPNPRRRGRVYGRGPKRRKVGAASWADAEKIVEKFRGRNLARKFMAAELEDIDVHSRDTCFFGGRLGGLLSVPSPETFSLSLF